MVKSKSIIFKIVSTILGVLLVIGAYFLINFLAGAKYDGTITIEIRDLDNNLVDSKEISFNNGEKLDELLIEVFDDKLVYETTDAYGMNISQIGSIRSETNDIYLTYIAIYQNGEYANLGVSFLQFKDKDIITFKLERYDYE